MSSTYAPLPPRPQRRSHRLGVRMVSVAVITVAGIALTPGVAAAAQAPVDLGTATSFAVLAGEGITNANATTIVGDVGSFPNPAQTGFATVTLTGTNHHGDAVAQQAKNDLVTAYDQAAGAGPPTAVAVELGGTTLKPGVYSGTTLEITGTLTLDTEGDPHAVFIFQSGSTLKTAANSAVTVLGNTSACNVFWKVPSSATLGTDSHLIGTVLASTAIAAFNGATIEGRLLAQTASVTLDHNTITTTPCTAPTPPDGTDSPGLTTTTDATPALTTGGSALVTTATSGGPPAGDAPASPAAPNSPPVSPPGAPASPGGPTPAAPPSPPLANTGLSGWLTVLAVALLGAGIALVTLSRSDRGPSPRGWAQAIDGP